VTDLRVLATTSVTDLEKLVSVDCAVAAGGGRQRRGGGRRRG